MLVVFKAAPILKRALKVRHALMQLYVLKLLKMQTKYLGRQWRKTNMKIISAIYEKVRHRLNDDWAFGNGEYIMNSFPFVKMIQLLTKRTLQFIHSRLDLDARPWDFQMEECTLRSCVDRFNNRRYLSGQTYLKAKNLLPNAMANTHPSGIIPPRQVVYTGFPNPSDGASVMMPGNAMANSLAVQSSITNGQQSDQYDTNAFILDFVITSEMLEGSQEKSANNNAYSNAYTNAYNNGYNWDLGDVDLSDEFKKHYDIWLQKEVFNIRMDWDSLLTVYDIELNSDTKLELGESNDAHQTPAEA